jgi:secreted trypsin-like serine protease
MQFIKRKKRWELIGITSWGFSRCSPPITPGVYTRVSTYHDFIKQIIHENRRKRNGANAAPALSSKQEKK